MARLSYSAPGVYVEEVPSARQPIAGVGTNTAAFIGIVPDVIYVPVPNPNYDPILARDLLNFSQLDARSQDGGLEAELARKARDELQRTFQDRINALDADHQKLLARQTDQQGKVDDAEAALKTAQETRDKLTDAATPEETGKAMSALQRAQNKFTASGDEAGKIAELIRQNRDERDNISATLANPAGAAPAVTAPAPGTGAGAPPEATAPGDGVETEETYERANPEPDAVLLQPSVLRPYYLERRTVRAPEFATKLCTNFTEYTSLFGDFSAFSEVTDDQTAGNPPGKRFVPLSPGHHMLTHAVNGFFANGGTRCFVARIRDAGALPKALERFKSIEELSILAAPGLPKNDAVWGPLQDYCEDPARPNVFAVLDAPAVVNDGTSNDFSVLRLQYENVDRVLPRKSTHAAYYFPHIEVMDPAKRMQDADPARDIAPKYRGRAYVAPSGHVAGVYARTDEERGVHKAPANAVVRGALEVKYYVSKPKQELLNPQGVNCIRLMNGDVTVWGARTIGGDRNGEWKYVSVRRFAGFLETSIDRGTQWVVFEPNDPGLWSKIILNVTAFLTNVWRSGALFGLTPEEAFYVKCDAELNPPEVRDLGQVITEIGVAIVRPAEFVIFRITQSTGENR